MSVKNCIYFILILISILSIVSLVYSKKNKNRYICKWIIMIDIIYIFYLIIISLRVIESLYIPVGLEILIIYLFEFVGGIFYIVSIIMNLIKRKKNEIYEKNAKVVFGIIVLVLLPIFFISLCILENKYWIDNSELVVVYESHGNGGFGDGDTFAYAIGEKFCKQFDLGIDIGGYRLKKFLPENSVEINDLEDTNYRIVFDDGGSTIVYKNTVVVCSINNKSDYYNINFEKGFEIKH